MGFIREYQAMRIDGKYFVCKYYEPMPAIEKMTSLKVDKYRLSESDLNKYFGIDLQHKSNRYINQKIKQEKLNDIYGKREQYRSTKRLRGNS